LVANYGPDAVFMDIDNIPFGLDFRTHIQDVLRGADALIAIIGPNWLGDASDGTRRIAQADDPVRAEIESAMMNAVPIIPVLLVGAKMPAASDLPPSIASLGFLNAATLDVGRDFHAHMARVIRATDDVLAQHGRPASLRGRQTAELSFVDWVVTSVRKRWFLPALCGAGALLLPVAAEVGSFAPPWPSGMAAITIVLMLIVAGISHEFLRRWRLSHLSRLIAIGAAVATVFALAYFAGVSRYTYRQPGYHGLWAKGLVCTADAQRLFQEKCPNLGLDELSGAEFHEDRLWTPDSIALVQSGLALAWLGMFGSLTIALVGYLAKREIDR